MSYLLRQKFSPGSELAERLLRTAHHKLVEGNHWHDNWWGCCECSKCQRRGKNYLGQLLEEIRKELQDAEHTGR